jgi:hypothetical protein
VVVGVGYVAPTRRRAKRQAAESLRVNTSRHHLSLRDMFHHFALLGAAHSRRRRLYSSSVYMRPIRKASGQVTRRGDSASPHACPNDSENGCNGFLPLAMM